MDAGLVKGEGFAVDASIIIADASRQRGVPGDEPVNWSDPALSTRAVREYLEALDEEDLAETPPKRLSLTNPKARRTAAPGGPAFYAYSTNYLIDTEHGVIMNVEPTPAHRTAEVESTKMMIDRVEAQFDIKTERLIGDTAYGTAPMLAWMVEEKISNRTCWCGIKTSVRTTVSRATISTGIKKLRNTAARPVTYCAAMTSFQEGAFARH